MRGDVWFVYDGECPLCRVAAQALRIRQSVGALHLVDARMERTTVRFNFVRWGGTVALGLFLMVAGSI